MKKQFYFTISVFLFAISSFSYAQPGTLDGDFDADGKVTTDLGSSSDYCRALSIQQDGKIIAVGSSSGDFAIVRYQPDGSLDNSFGTNGKVITTFGGQDHATCMALQQDGKILVAGSASGDFGLVRYNSDGSIDNTFSFNGIVIADLGGGESVGSMELQPDGKIVVVGSTEFESGGMTEFDFAVVRYNIDGTLDNTFSLDGKVTTDLGNSTDVGRSVSLQSDGKIVVSGESYLSLTTSSDFASVRYNSDGTLDNSFGTNGIVLTDYFNSPDGAQSSIIQPDGKIILAGYATDNGGSIGFALVRYNMDGSLDDTFTNGGQILTSVATGNGLCRSVSLQPDGKILLAGFTSGGSNDDFALVRYTAEGLLDLSFLFGSVTTDFGNSRDRAFSVAVQPDGKIVLGGQRSNNGNIDFALARYISGLTVGVVDFADETSPPLIYPNPIGHTAQLEFELIKDEVIDILLYDISGKLIQSIMRNVQMIKGQNEIPLNFNNSITTGNYLLVIKSATGKQGIKITIE
ncbi:MAG: T9SS type A sorting domain-containing protein [Saprospiraceae bacterium]|nr:T9SS type A sorting domain-containing protein [Saprospiraceae bacterium]